MEFENSAVDFQKKLLKMTMYIKGMKICKSLISFTNFETVQFCGEGKNGQRTTKVIRLKNV